MSNPLLPVLESLIFISQEPLTMDRLRVLLENTTPEDIQAALEELIQAYAADERGIRVIHTGGGYVFATKSEHDLLVRRLLQIERKNKLSSAALETLSAVAYHQPVTQAEVSMIRGVDSTYTLKTLLEKRLIKIVGRKKAPGNPLVYRTSERFLQYFGLNSLDELPSEAEIAKILEEDKATEG